MVNPRKTHHRILLTGAAGGLGTALRERLKANCDVLRLSDKNAFGDAQAGEEIALADLADAGLFGARGEPGFARSAAAGTPGVRAHWAACCQAWLCCSVLSKSG